MSLREQLQTIYDENGRLTPDIVLREAQNPAHPLHARFEWEDSIAAEKYRRDQAGRLIRTVKIVYREADGVVDAGKVRAFHAIPDAEGMAYKPVEEIVEDEFARTLLLREMERAWKQLQSRYAHFAEFVDMVRRDVAAEAS